MEIYFRIFDIRLVHIACLMVDIKEISRDINGWKNQFLFKGKFLLLTSSSSFSLAVDSSLVFWKLDASRSMFLINTVIRSMLTLHVFWISIFMSRDNELVWARFSSNTCWNMKIYCPNNSRLIVQARNFCRFWGSIMVSFNTRLSLIDWF